MDTKPLSTNPLSTKPLNIKQAFIRTDYHIMAFLLAIVFILQASLALYWHSIGIFQQFNVIYDSDPNLWLKYFRTGHSGGTPTHPLLVYYVAPPIAAISWLVSFFYYFEDAFVFREYLAVLASPLVTSLKCICIYMAVKLMGLSRFKSFFIACVSALSFSSLAFGALPSSYPFTGFLFALAYTLAILSFIYANKLTLWGTVLAGFFAIGVTSSNVAHLGWLLWLRFFEKSGRLVSSFLKSASISAVILIAVLASYFALTVVRGGQLVVSDLISNDKSFLEAHTPELSESIINFVRFPERIARTYIPTEPVKKDNRLYIEGEDKYNFELTYNYIELNMHSALLWIIASIVLLGGLMIAYRLGGLWRWIGLSAAGSVATYWLLYSYFGYNTYLYSQHWQVSVIFLLAPWLKLNVFNGRYSNTVLLSIVCLWLLADFYMLNKMNTIIATSAVL